MGVLAISFVAPLRRHAWELFYRVHVLLAGTLAIIITLHGGFYAWCGIGLWVFDLFLRYLIVRHRNPRSAKSRVLPADTTKIIIETDSKFSFRAGQYIFLCVPELSIFEWHPFSISSAPAQAAVENKIELHVRALGSWTQSLRKLAAEKGQDKQFKVLCEGPYGEPQINIEGGDYTHFLLISGGIGVTPMQSVCNQLLDEHKRGRPMDLVQFIWTCRDQGFPDFADDAGLTALAAPPPPPSPLRRTRAPRNLHDRYAISLPDTVGDTQPRQSDLEEGGGEWSCWAPRWISPSNDNENEHPAVVVETREITLDANSNCIPLWFQPSNLLPRTEPQCVVRSSKHQNNCPASRNFDILRTGFYLTGRPSPTVEGATSHGTFHSGRPDLPMTFATMAAAATKKGQSRVAVMTCGPSRLVKAVTRQCMISSVPGAVQFDCHVETFEL